MLARLLLILLLAAFPLPAAAAPCHEAPAPAAHASAGHNGSHHQAPEPEAAVPHACVGCVPPSGLLAPRVAAPVLVVATEPVALVRSLDAGPRSPPALPPPRQG